MKTINVEVLAIVRDNLLTLIESMRLKFPDIWYEIECKQVEPGKHTIHVEAKCGKNNTASVFIDSGNKMELVNNVTRITKKVIDNEIIEANKRFINGEITRADSVSTGER